MTYAVIAFLTFFLLLTTGLLLVFYREALGQRLASILESSNGPELVSQPKPIETFASFATYVDRLLPKSDKDVSLIRARLGLAGFRRDWHVSAFKTVRILLPLLVGVTGLMVRTYHTVPMVVVMALAGVAYLLPNQWLGYRIRARQENIRIALPDVLDLLVVCLEAGLSMDQAVMRASEEMRTVHAALSDELNLITLDLRGGRSRVDAWKALAERTEVDTIRVLVSILIQADQFGTGISRTLRVHADTLRTRRKQRAEEMAAKTTIKIIFPLVLFIFPSLFVVTLGGAVISILEAFKGLK